MLLLVEKPGKGRGLGNRVGAVREELLVADEAGGVRAVAGDVDCLKGKNKPLGAAVQQVELGVHCLDQGRVEGLLRDMGQGVPESAPAFDGLGVRALEVAEQRGGVPVNRLHGEGGDGNGPGCNLVQADLQRPRAARGRGSRC